MPIHQKDSFAPSPSKGVRLGIVGVGGCGTNTIRDLALRLDPDENPGIRLCAANTDGPQLWDFFLADDVPENIQAWVAPRKNAQNQTMPPQLEVLQLGASGAGAGGKPDVAREAAESRRDAIAAFLDTVDVVVIQCGLGGGTGTGATPTIVEMAKSMGKLPLVIATQPFKFEGKKRLDRAAAAREELLQQVPTITIYNDRLPNKKIMFDEAWKKVTECGLLPPLLALRKLLQVVGAHVNRDLADYGTALSAGNHVLSICAEDINPNDDVKSTIAKLMEGNPYQDMEILKTADYIIPTYEGPWGVGEVWEINQFITEQVRTLSDDFEMNYFIGDTKGPKSVGMLVVAKAPPAKATSSIPSFSSSAMDPAARSFFAQPVKPFEEPPALVRDSTENHNHQVRPKPGWID